MIEHHGPQKPFNEEKLNINIQIILPQYPPLWIQVLSPPVLNQTEHIPTTTSNDQLLNNTITHLGNVLNIFYEHNQLVDGFALGLENDAKCKQDERPCADNGECISKLHWCDKQIHCPDASDETGCSCHDRIDKDKLCDGYFDCPHGEDEAACHGEPLNSN